MADLKTENKNQELLESSSWGSVKIARKEGIIENLVTVSANYQMLKNDRFVIADTACTVTLPVVNAGKEVVIKSTVAGTIVIDGGDYNIDGAGTQSLTSQYEWLRLVFTGIEWSNV